MHQDEYKWALFLDNGNLTEFPHPIVAPISYHAFFNYFGVENLRILPIIISFIGHLIAVLLVQRELGYSRGILFNLLFTINPFVVLGNYQIDIDGSYLIFFTVLYIYLSTSKSSNNIIQKLVIPLVVIIGMLTKFSFILILFSHLITVLYKKDYEKASKIFKYLILSFLILIFVKFFQPSSSNYSSEFILNTFSSRNISQIVFLTCKSLLLIGPIILFARIKYKNRNAPEVDLILFSYLIVIIFFYLIIFNFSERTLDRYLLAISFPIIYLSLDKIFTTLKVIKYYHFFWSIIALLVVFGLYLLNFEFEVVPLHPKGYFAQKLLNFDLNFLIPFFTGSGPIGFYVPLGLLLFTFGLAVISILVKSYKQLSLLAFSSVLLLSLFFFIESSSGHFFGNASNIAKNTIARIPNNSPTITYNDIGGYELNKINSYLNRLYLNPNWKSGQVGKMENLGGLFLLVNMPDIDEKSWLWEYLKKCEIIFSVRDKKVEGKIFRCNLPKVKEIKLN